MTDEIKDCCMEQHQNATPPWTCDCPCHQADKEEERRMRYVTAYAVDQCYGGPEEGGWWYDSGEKLCSVPVTTDAEEEKVKGLLYELFNPWYENNRTRFSVIGETNLEIYVSDEPGAHFPTERPHYE